MTNGQYWFLKKLLIVWGRYRLVSFLSLDAFVIIILLVSKGLCCYCRLGWVSSRKSCINRPDPDSEPNLAQISSDAEYFFQVVDMYLINICERLTLPRSEVVERVATKAVKSTISTPIAVR